MKTLHHARLLKLGLDTCLTFVTQIVKAYGSEALSDAQKLFDQCPHRDIILWNSLISVYARSNQPHHALHLFALLHSQSFPAPNHFAFATAAHACAAASSLTFGQSLHACTVKHGFLSNVVVGTALLDMYAKCYAIDLSKKMFSEMPERNRVTWNVIMYGHVLNGLPAPGLELFCRMVFVEHFRPDEFSLATALVACGSANYLSSGRQIHGFIVRSGFEEDFKTARAVCSMYMRCGDIPGAETMLKNRADDLELELIVIKGYYLNGRHLDMLSRIGHNLMQALMLDPNLVFYVLTACASLSLLKLGRQAHGIVITSNYYLGYSSSDVTVLGCALMDMYCKCGVVQDAERYFNLLTIPQVSHFNSLLMGYIHNGLHDQARSFFEEMPEKDVISWTSMISGYVQSGFPSEALVVLAEMYNQVEFVRGNCFTFSASLDACALLTALDQGKQIHAHFVRTAQQNDDDCMVVETTLVNAYSKSGNLNYARSVFDRMWKKNVLSWTSMIMGYAVHGYGSQAVECFDKMVRAGEEPNEVTFVAVLTACSRCGLVEEGLSYFKLMKERYGIAPKSDHYTCMVDLLGRSGKLADAYRLMNEINQKVDGHVDHQLGALLNGCLLHGNVEMGAMLAKKILGMKQQISETYISISHVYASADMWEQAYGVRQELKNHGAVKDPGKSVVSVRA